ncbi:MAG: cupin domain-containing protein [Terriglobia bacterium]
MEYSRRRLGLLLPAILAAPRLFATGQDMLPSKAYPFADIPVQSKGRNKSRRILAGETHTGFPISMNENDIAPGGIPHPPHHHVAEQVFIVLAGELEFTIAGQTTRLGPSSAAYVASNVEHGLKNNGTSPARYCVITLGKNA